MSTSTYEDKVTGLLSELNELGQRGEALALENADLRRELGHTRADRRAFRGASIVFAGSTLALLIGHLWRSLL